MCGKRAPDFLSAEPSAMNVIRAVLTFAAGGSAKERAEGSAKERVTARGAQAPNLPGHQGTHPRSRPGIATDRAAAKVVPAKTQW